MNDLKTWPRDHTLADIIYENYPFRMRRCRDGIFLYNINDFYIGGSLDLYGEFSEGEAHFFKSFIKPHMIVIDAGANIGVHTVTFAKLARYVFAFEPQRIVFQMLGGNLALNNVRNVSTFQMALGKNQGYIRVPSQNYDKIGNFGGVTLGSNEGEQVPMTTIDEFHLEDCHLIKMDVEGMEGEIIEGAVETIEKFRPVLYAENNPGNKQIALIRQILDLKYRIFLHQPPLYNPQNFYGNPENIFDHIKDGNLQKIVSYNMICVPKEKMDVKIEGLEEVTLSSLAFQDTGGQNFLSPKDEERSQ